MLKLKMMLCVMMLPLVVVGCTSKQSVSQCEATTPPADNAASPRLADTAEWDYFSTSREADHSAASLNWKEPRKYINEQWIELPISMGNSCNYWEQYTRASSGV